MMKYFVFATLLFLLSCKKDYSCEDCSSSTILTSPDAIIYWTGGVEVDGCDWAILIDSVFYHPRQLDQVFKQDQLPVTVEYYLTAEKYSCGNGPGGGLPVIHLVNIKK